MKNSLTRPPAGVGIAFLAAALFGASTPFVKLLLGQIAPVLLAGLLYLGSGLGLSLLRLIRQRQAIGQAESGLTRDQWPWFAGAVLFGGSLGPVLLTLGLKSAPAASTSLLLNLEGVFTALLAWFVFRENFDRRIALGMATIVAGGVMLSWQPGSQGLTPGTLFIIGACLCWAIDNNLTQKVSSSDPFQIAAIKGLVAGSVNLAIAFVLGAAWPAAPALLCSLVLGFFGYGLSLACFVIALRLIGTARTGAYFALAPFVGTALSLLLLHESVGPLFFAAAALMGIGVWLHLSERHEHVHDHEWLKHAHRHSHDEHHQHTHAPGVDTRESHSHEHVHEPMTHSHTHFPDIHHRHDQVDSSESDTNADQASE